MKTTYTYFNDGSKKVVSTFGQEIWYDAKENIHRLDGPAITFVWTDFDQDPNSETYQERIVKTSNEWFWHGKKMNVTSQEQFARLLDLKLFW